MIDRPIDHINKCIYDLMKLLGINASDLQKDIMRTYLMELWNKAKK